MIGGLLYHLSANSLTKNLHIEVGGMADLGSMCREDPSLVGFNTNVNEKQNTVSQTSEVSI